jgi:hypothetical protein
MGKKRQRNGEWRKRKSKGRMYFIFYSLLMKCKYPVFYVTNTGVNSQRWIGNDKHRSELRHRLSLLQRLRKTRECISKHTVSWQIFETGTFHRIIKAYCLSKYANCITIDSSLLSAFQAFFYLRPSTMWSELLYKFYPIFSHAEFKATLPAVSTMIFSQVDKTYI